MYYISFLSIYEFGPNDIAVCFNHSVLRLGSPTNKEVYRRTASFDGAMRKLFSNMAD